MRIALFTDIYLDIPGGIPSSIKAQKSALQKLGHQVTIFCPGDQTNNTEKDLYIVPTHRLLRPNQAPLAKRPKKILQSIKKDYPVFSDYFDLVHVHYEASCSIAGVKLAKEHKLKLIQTMHGREDIAINANLPAPTKYLVAKLLNIMHSISLGRLSFKTERLPRKDNFLIKNSVCQNMWQLMVRQANLADAIVSPSAHFAKNLKQYGVKKPIHVISNGVDDSYLQNLSFSVRFFKPNEHLRIIWNSRLSKEKRILPFLQSVANSKHKDKIDLTIIGDGNQMQEAKNFAKSHLQSSQIKFLGIVPHEQIFNFMQNQHISVINSYGFDTQGMTILEAVACGLPVLYADPAMDEVVPEHGGLRSSNDSVAAMTGTIDQLFAHPTLIEEMSKNTIKAKDSVLQSTQINKLLELYLK